MDIAQMYPHPFRNDSGEEVPPFSVMRVTGQTVLEGQAVFTTTKPDTTFSRMYAVSGPTPVPSGKPGSCATDGVVVGCYDTGSATFGVGYGAKVSQWTLSLGYLGGWPIIGDLTAGEFLSGQKLATFHIGIINSVIGKLDGTLAQGSTQTVSVWAGVSGSEVDTTVNVLLVRDFLMKSGETAIASGKKCIVTWINGIPYASEIECR